MNNRLQVFAALLAENTATNTMTQRQRLATCSTSPSYAEVGLSRFGINSDFVEELNKTNAITESYLTQISDNNDTFFTPKAYQYALICVLRLDVLILETRGFYEKLNRRKSKGHSATTLQPFKH